MIVKICGLKEARHAEAAAKLGANLLGFVFAESPRKTTPQQVREIIRQLPLTARKVGVFVDEDSQQVNDIVSFCGLDMAQLHGRETPDDCRKIFCPVIKGFRVSDAKSLEALEPYRNIVELFLLDTYVPGLAGGSGQTFDWSLARQAAKYGMILLAGGLNPENVGSAIKTAMPSGVDVSSGVETDGRKDLAKIEAFIKQVRGQQHV